MYKILNAVGIEKSSFDGWKEIGPVAAGNSPIFLLFLQYDKVLLKLSNPESMEMGWANIYDFPEPIRTSGVKMVDYISQAKPHTIKLYSDDANVGENQVKYVRSLFANDYGFVQKLVNKNFHPDSNLAPDQMLDLMISHPEIQDYQPIVDNALFTVNGLIHRGVALEKGIMLLEGGRTMVKSNDNRVGILDFKGVGGVTCKTFEDSWLTVPAGKDAYKASYFTLPFDIAGKSLMLVMGGFLYFIDPVIDVVGVNRIKINFRFIDFISQFYANYDRIYRPEDFPLTPHPVFKDRFVTQEFFTEEYIRATLKLSQSFFVVVNTPKVIVRTAKLDRCNTPNEYRYYGEGYPDMPIKVGHGYLPEFNVFERAHFYSVRLPNSLRSRPVRTKSVLEDYKLVRDQNFSDMPKVYADAERLIIMDGAGL